MVRMLALFLLVGCATSAMDPELSLRDRFVLTALTEDDGSSKLFVDRWERPIYIEYQGPQRFRQDVAEQIALLGQITGLPVKMDANRPTMFVEISDRDTRATCQVEFSQGSPGAHVHIYSRLTDSHIRSCIIEELTQAMGPSGDLDGPFGSRTDTIFASRGGADHLTKQDIAVLLILYDDRLYDGMARDEVLAILPDIVADVEEAQATQAP